MRAQHVLVTTDLSEEARRAYEPVAALARSWGAKVTLLHVVEAISNVPAGAMLAPAVPLEDPAETRRKALAALEQECELLGPDLDVRPEVLAAEGVARAIADYAAEHGVELVALSTHGRTGLRRMILGSVAESVLRHVRVPVLCFPPPPAADGGA